MHKAYSLLTQYCQFFGYSSCRNLTAVDKFLLFAIGSIAVLAVAGIPKRILTGISH